MLSVNDLKQLEEKNISQKQVETQLYNFKTGFPFLKIVSAASIEKGVLKLDDKEQQVYLDAWTEYLNQNKKITKFVPASGAASRMFKDLYEFIDAKYNTPTTEFEKEFFDNLKSFAFYDALNDACVVTHSASIEELISKGEYKKIVAALLHDTGLNYGNLPKGLLFFHTDEDKTKTPVEEHLTEGSLYAKNNAGKVNIHFTVSEEHQKLFESLVLSKKDEYEQLLKASFDISYSVQKSSTDTIAAELENDPFRNEDGSLLFRPGGHGALIENLNDIDSDVVFIKNIDNVIPDRLKEEEAQYKKVLAGVLVTVQQKAHNYLEELTGDKIDEAKLQEVLKFTQEELFIDSMGRIFEDDADLRDYLIAKLNRPYRICGMVKNEGEPGGGPFIAVNPDGTASLQILEGSQIDTEDAEAMNAFKNGSHFNPVDLVCGVKNHKGDKFDLTQYVDKNTGFISLKSSGGKELKALELPGLWNGAMSDWNTIFVEVPVSTFNPVKTVNDLLRPEHQ